MLPTAAPEELPGMVEIQIAKELPFAVADAAVDFVAGEPQGELNTLAVQVAAVRREALEQYEATFAAAGLRLERVGLRPYANKLAVCELLKHAIPERVMFIDVRPTLTEIDVLKHSSLAFSRAASVLIPADLGEDTRLTLVRDEAGPESPQGSDDSGTSVPTSKLDRVVEALVLEVTRTIEAYRVAEPGAAIDHAVIGGDLGVEEALAEAVQKRLDVTTEIYNPASTFGWEPDEGAAAAAFAATLGLVLGQVDETSAHFDFLHPKKPVSVTEERLKKAPLVAAVVVLFVAAGGVFGWQITNPKRESLTRINEKIAELKENTKENKKFLNLVDSIRAFDEKPLVWVDVLYDAMSTLPSHEELVLTHLEMNQKDAKIVIKTKGKTAETATELVERLNVFRRPGAVGARFRARIGPQTEKPAERYPFSQTVHIEIHEDGVEHMATVIHGD
jgi:Tfp pilus assembly PilM family ATPase